MFMISSLVDITSKQIFYQESLLICFSCKIIWSNNFIWQTWSEHFRPSAVYLLQRVTRMIYNHHNIDIGNVCHFSCCPLSTTGEGCLGQFIAFFSRSCFNLIWETPNAIVFIPTNSPLFRTTSCLFYSGIHLKHFLFAVHTWMNHVCAQNG